MCESVTHPEGILAVPPHHLILPHSHASVPTSGDVSERLLRLQVHDMINCCLSLPSFASSFPVGLHSCRYGLVSRSPLLNLIHLPSIPPSILPDTSQQAKTTFLVGCSLFIFLCLLLAFLSFPSRFFTPIINSVVLSCALFH